MAAYSQAIAFLESFINYELHRGRMKYNTRALHLRRFERFLRSLGSPHRATPFIHVAGTKGKGSTAALLHSIVTEAGFRAGLYTSPHLESYCERIRIGRSPVSERDFAKAVESLRHRLERGGVRLEAGYRTTFELLTTVAFEMFRDAGVELGILETGLGGRLDATNVVSPAVSVITAIGLDHTHLLGTTHAAIAREKAGIIKPGRPVVLARQSRGHAGQVCGVVREICRRRKSPFCYAPRLVQILSRIGRAGGQTVRYRLRRSNTEIKVHLPLLGEHQAENMRTALAVVEVLRARGWTINNRAIGLGARNVHWPGRIEWLGGRPPFVLDGAHCPLSVEALVQTLREQCPADRPVFVFSLLDDKPVEATVAPVARAFRGCEIVVFRAPTVRGRPAEALAAPLKEMGFVARAATSPSDALRQAFARASAHTPVVAFGSLYSVAPLKKAYQRLTFSDDVR
jgi:dihydrofolate synthase/folylpolyglutamate synthase